MSLPRGLKPKVLSLTSKSLCHTHAASGKPYKALFNLLTLPGLSYHLESKCRCCEQFFHEDT